LPGTDLEQAAAVAERIRSEVERMCIDHESSHTSAHVTVSIGVAGGITDAIPGPYSLMDAADNAMYQAKREGRNRVCASRVPD
jgi:diguanylate cyclase (GGDEF)-like protein